MSESVKKRAADSKLLAEKSAARADAESELQMRKEARDGSVKEHMATGSYIASLHSECDWLVQYYDVRKEARAGEVDSLQKACTGTGTKLLQSSGTDTKMAEVCLCAFTLHDVMIDPIFSLQSIR